jgi:hypothetical protein
MVTIEDMEIEHSLKQYKNDERFSIILGKVQNQMNQGKFKPRRNSDLEADKHK